MTSENVPACIAPVIIPLVKDDNQQCTKTGLVPGILVVGSPRRILFINRRALQLLGLSTKAGEIFGPHGTICLQGESIGLLSQTVADFWELVQSHGHTLTGHPPEMTLRTSGAERPLRVRILALFDEDRPAHSRIVLLFEEAGSESSGGRVAV